MNKNISYGKLSKKEKRKEDTKKRISWSEFGDISPITQIVKSKKAYSRAKFKKQTYKALTGMYQLFYIVKRKPIFVIAVFTF